MSACIIARSATFFTELSVQLPMLKWEPQEQKKQTVNHLHGVGEGITFVKGKK